MITGLGGVELSRNAIVGLLNAERAERAEALAADRAREEAAAERIERAEAEARTHYMIHGEWPAETRLREADVAARAEARAEEKRRIERAGQQQAYQAQLLAAGRQPRTISEVLEIVAMLP